MDISGKELRYFSIYYLTKYIIHNNKNNKISIYHKNYKGKYDYDEIGNINVVIYKYIRLGIEKYVFYWTLIVLDKLRKIGITFDSNSIYKSFCTLFIIGHKLNEDIVFDNNEHKKIDFNFSSRNRSVRRRSYKRGRNPSRRHSRRNRIVISK